MADTRRLGVMKPWVRWPPAGGVVREWEACVSVGWEMDCEWGSLAACYMFPTTTSHQPRQQPPHMLLPPRILHEQAPTVG